MVRAIMISQEAVNMVPDRVYGDVTATWLPQEFIFASTGSNSVTNHENLDIKHLCAHVVHPVTGETITNYKKLQADPILRNYGVELGVKNLGTWHKAMN